MRMRRNFFCRVGFPKPPPDRPAGASACCRRMARAQYQPLSEPWQPERLPGLHEP
jgi:hypothetical protein